VLPSIANSSNDETTWQGSIDQVIDSSSFNQFEMDTYSYLKCNSNDCSFLDPKLGLPTF